ncbi:DUF6371 domain-containing protein [Lutibacter citreus]|uniref:DUF6371 domain-containing protein n=1 Tax=Lutibacter citreus TaxID=2138210 RepID=UPI000DBE01EE|nr:DUF6371 domain-containing protein [Lutibacter citreus]
MKNKLSKIELKLEFNPKRNYQLVTPCCHKSNKDGKFSNYKHLPEKYGYCHSCGKSTLPPTRYNDENGLQYEWNITNNCFEPVVLQMYSQNVLQMADQAVGHCKTAKNFVAIEPKYIPKALILRYKDHKPENNLLQYIRLTYGNKNTELVKKLYYIGSSKDGGTVFWNINKNQKAQKAKVSYYTKKGKRTNKFKVPFKNSDGYYSCLFGEHLINLPENKNKTIILAESEKTAIICALYIPEYTWLSYGGINGLTRDKLNVLIGRKIILVPDLSENAVTIMNKKLPFLKELGIDAKVWDMTNGKTDDQLKNEGWYNCDLEDILRGFSK